MGGAMGGVEGCASEGYILLFDPSHTDVLFQSSQHTQSLYNIAITFTHIHIIQ